MPRLPKLSLWTRKAQWLKKENEASKSKCCGNCIHYKRDYKCTKEPDAYISSTSQHTDCKDWVYVERMPTYHR